MNKHRKEIIMNEIEYWKKSRLLPEQYCDFLLTLYSEGEHESKNGHKTRKFSMSAWLQYLPFFIMLGLPISFLFVYFTEFNFVLQITIKSLIMGISIILSIVYWKKNRLYLTFFLVFSLLLFFLNTVFLTEYFFGRSAYIIGTVIVFHCVIWYLIGRLSKLTYLRVSGIAALILFIFYLIVTSTIN
ncbi:hypothetical protein ACFSCX_08395 [Bacillus salitolerans]|uniref:DUF1700 domain-containing protein n=1 Tax=Bacillus salitolerans TaxID=1437434 RepID=A0ABW4LP83_9BACI